MAKTVKLKEEFTLESNIFFAIVEVIGIPVILLLLFWRFGVVYSNTPPPVWDNLMSYWWKDMTGDFCWLYLVIVASLILWIVAKALRFIERNNKEQWWAMTLFLIAKNLGISDSDVDAEFRRREIASKIKNLKALPGQNTLRKQFPKRQRVARKRQ